jgi:hypothetical protein
MITVICLLISCAIIVPWFFPQISNDDQTGWLTLTYSVEEQVFRNGTELQSTERTHNLTYVASMNNMELILSWQYYYGFPLVTNVSSWEIHDDVKIGTENAIVIEQISIGERDCWSCEINPNKSVIYDKVTGLLVQIFWITFDSVPYGTQETVTTVRMVSMDHDVPGEGYPSQDGLFIAGILIELAIVVWLVPNYLKKKQLQS